MPNPLHADSYSHFVDLLRSCREEAGITQAQLAANLNVPQSYVSKGEAGSRRLDVIELREWLRALNVPLTDFMASLDDTLTHTADAAERLSMGKRAKN